MDKTNSKIQLIIGFIGYSVGSYFLIVLIADIFTKDQIAWVVTAIIAGITLVLKDLPPYEG